jgi:hypothetical protein
VKNSLKIRENPSDPSSFYQMLRRKGGVSGAGVVAAVALAFVFSVAMTLLLGTNAITAIYNAMVQSMF